MEQGAIVDYFNSMTGPDFDRKFLNLWKTEEFSAIASGFGTEKDFRQLKLALQQSGVPIRWLANHHNLNFIVRCITKRVIEKI